MLSRLMTDIRLVWIVEHAPLLPTYLPTCPCLLSATRWFHSSPCKWCPTGKQGNRATSARKISNHASLNKFLIYSIIYRLSSDDDEGYCHPSIRQIIHISLATRDSHHVQTLRFLLVFPGPTSIRGQHGYVGGEQAASCQTNKLV